MIRERKQRLRGEEREARATVPAASTCALDSAQVCYNGCLQRRSMHTLVVVAVALILAVHVADFFPARAQSFSTLGCSTQMCRFL